MMFSSQDLKVLKYKTYDLLMNNRGLTACRVWAEFSLIGGSGGLSPEVDYLLISHPYIPTRNPPPLQ